MDFWGAVQVIRRRWYAVLGALVVSSALAALVYVLIPTQYESTGVAVLTSPASGAKFSEKARPEDVERINPLLAFDSSLTITAQIIGQVLRDPATEDELGAGAGAAATYTVTNGDATISGPFLFVTVLGNSPEASQGLAEGVLDRAASELRDRQRAINAPESTFIQPEVLVHPTVPEAKINGKIRFAGAALVLCLIGTLAATFAWDSIPSRRQRRSGLLTGDGLGSPPFQPPRGGVQPPAAAKAPGAPHLPGAVQIEPVVEQPAVEAVSALSPPAESAAAPAAVGSGQEVGGKTGSSSRRPRPRLNGRSPAPPGSG